MNSLSNNDDHSQDRDKEPVIPSFLLGGPRWPNVTASSAQEQMPTAGERIAALEAEVAALRDAVAALRLEAVPGALAALAAGQADIYMYVNPCVLLAFSTSYFIHVQTWSGHGTTTTTTRDGT